MGRPTSSFFAGRESKPGTLNKFSLGNEFLFFKVVCVLFSEPRLQSTLSEFLVKDLAKANKQSVRGEMPCSCSCCEPLLIPGKVEYA